MKKLDVFLVVLVIVLLAVVVGCSGDGGSYAQLSSAVDQEVGDEPIFVKFEQDDGSNGVVLADNGVSVDKAGLYLVVAAPQVTASADDGCLSVWLTVNGVDVDNSNVEICQTKEGDTDVIISQGVVQLEKDDLVQVKASSNTAAFLDAISPVDEPLIPSIIFTIAEQ